MIIIEFYSKNFALSDTIEIQSNVVPRVGETITIEQSIKFFDINDELLVHSVTYIVKDNNLTPLIKCHASNGSINRRIILEENGWI